MCKMIENSNCKENINECYKQKGWSKHQLDPISWTSIRDYLSKLSPIKRCNMIQLMHNWQNTGLQKGRITL